MNPNGFKHHFVAAMAKHLPPSAARLRLVDMDGQCGHILESGRADLDIRLLAADAAHLSDIPPDSVDAVVAYDIELKIPLLERVCAMLRPGGRFIAVLPTGQVNPSWVELLESHNYRRILVEAAVDGMGVLIRGEKAHHSEHTWQRIQAVAGAEGDLLDLGTFKGRYVHLLIRQTPSKPVWKLAADEEIRWQALALRRGADRLLLGFSSLPKAVGFMQPAVVAGRIQGINKVGKFRKARAMAWTWGVMLNPNLDAIGSQQLAFVEIDPSTAEAPNE